MYLMSIIVIMCSDQMSDEFRRKPTNFSTLRKLISIWYYQMSGAL